MTNEESEWEDFISPINIQTYEKLDKMIGTSFDVVYQTIKPLLTIDHQKSGQMQITNDITIFNVHTCVVGICINGKWTTLNDNFDRMIAKELSQSK